MKQIKKTLKLNAKSVRILSPGQLKEISGGSTALCSSGDNTKPVGKP